MVLRNYVVLVLAGALWQVTATPHGYGVKGGAGAVAKAEASASAGAFSGLPPIPIPSGSGFSGSYSKSSSSSFASSSASASSSSFSFSGSGANAINGFDISGGCSSGSCGCPSGTCGNGGNNIKTNNGDQGKYGAGAQSVANNNQGGSDCTSGQCGNKPGSSCTGAACSSNEGIPSTNCPSGNCGQTNSPNDIFVNIPGRSTYNQDGSYKYDNANIGQSLPINGKPSTFKPECNSYDCISASENPDEKRPSSYDVPIFGTTIPSWVPDKKEPCTSADCQSDDNINSNSLKPGYNNNLPGTKSPEECAGGACASQTTTSPESNNSLKPFTSSYNAGATSSAYVPASEQTFNSPGNCGSLGCDNTAQPSVATNSNNHQSYESSIKSTSSSQNEFSPTGQSNCEGPTCGGSNYQKTNINTNQPSNSFKYPGDCGILGCGLTFQPGESNSGNQEFGKGSVDNSFTSVDQAGCNGFGCSTSSLGGGGPVTKQPYFSSQPSNCGPSGCTKSGNANCGSSGCASTGGNIPSYSQPGYGGGVSSSKPGQTSQLPSQSFSTQSTLPPSYSSGYTNPYSSSSYAPSSPVASPHTELEPPNQHSGSGEGTTPNAGYNPNQSTLNSKPNSSGYAGVTKPHYEATASANSIVPSNPSYFPSTPQYSQNTNLPSKPISENQGLDTKPNNNKQVYTGGFGAPQGPIDQSIPAKPHGSTVSPSTHTIPSQVPSVSSYGPGQNVNPSYSSSTPQYSHNTNLPSKPINENQGLGVKPNNNKQVYTGGFGAPQGPIDQSIPAKPHVESTVSPSTQAKTIPSQNPSYGPGSQNGNPSYSPSTPQYSQNTNIPLKPGNENPGFSASNSPKPSNNKPAYTGGFGAPQGPINQSIPAKPHVEPTVAPTQSNTPSQAPSAPSYGPTKTGSYNQNHVQNSPVPNVNVPQDTSGKKGVPYTGGFGGPSGFLNPNDYSVPAKPLTPGTGVAQPNVNIVPTKLPSPTPGPSNVAPCTSYSCGSKLNNADLSSATHNGIANTNVHAQAAASAVAYTGGFGGPPGFLKPFDDGKVPANSANPSYNSQGFNGNLGYSSNNKNAEQGNHGHGINGYNAGAVAQANAVATSSAGSYGAGLNGGGVKGCSLGCGANSGNGDGFDADNHGVSSGAVASAKSVAGAGSYGASGSFASSSASAHASAGAATKGGYGRK